MIIPCKEDEWLCDCQYKFTNNLKSLKTVTKEKNDGILVGICKIMFFGGWVGKKRDISLNQMHKACKKM